MLRFFRLSVYSQNVEEVENYLLENLLITGILPDPTPDHQLGVVDITVMVRNKRNFLRWASPKRKFIEASDPIHFLKGSPVEIPTPRKSTDKSELKRVPATIKKSKK